jgi:hypothetical protein
MYYNTNNLKAKRLIKALVKAKSQEDKVKIIFNCYGKMTASEVWEFFDKTKTPLTSIRRAISNLSNLDFGYLIITDEMKEGLFGMPEHYYKLNNEPTLF